MGIRTIGRASTSHGVEALESRLLLSVTLVKDLNPNYSSNPTNFVSAGGVGYFTAYNSLNQPALWRTDGTFAGTFIPAEKGHFSISLPSQLTAVGNRIFLTAGAGAELWVADSTASGTMRINAGMGMSGLGNLTAVGDLLYFTATTSGAGQELWRSDGTPGGTYMVADIRPGTASSAIGDLTDAGGTLFFFASDGVTFSQLWKVDSGGVASRITNLSDGLYGAIGPQKMGVLDGRVIFYAYSHDLGDRIWRSDGTTAGTYLLKDITLSNVSLASPFVVWNGFAYMGARNAAYGAELWRTDGTVAGTALVADINPGTSGSLAYPRAVAGGYLLFSAADGVSATGTGGELYRTDGTIGNASLVKDINPGTASSGPFNFVTVAEGIGYFTADDGTTGGEIWRTDGTAAGTYRVADIYPGATTSNPQGGVLIDGGIIFSANNVSYVNRELYMIPIDHVAPTVGAPEFLYDNPRGPALRVTFSESVRDALAGGDLVLLNRTTGTTVNTDNLLLNYDAETNVATFHFPATSLADGNYQISFADGAVTDAAENPLVAGFTFDFFVLAGDANHDRSVDFQDLVALAQNYNSSGKTFSQGDFNDDGKVDFNDLVLLAQRYNTTLPKLPDPPAVPLAVAKPAPLRKTVASTSVFATQPIVSSSRPSPRPPVAQRPGGA